MKLVIYQNHCIIVVQLHVTVSECFCALSFCINLTVSCFCIHSLHINGV